MILTVPVPSFQSYTDNPHQVLQAERSCPECKTRRLSRHGVYRRWVYSLDDRAQIPVFRLRCRPCGLTFALLPEFLLPLFRYALEIIETALDACLQAKSCRVVAVELSGVEIPADFPRTDALTWTRTRPSFQRVHAWLSAVAAAAAADVQAAAEWLVRRKPDALAVDLLTVPTEAVHFGSCDPEKRKALTATRLLVRLFGGDPDLNPRGLSWLTAWSRFAMTLLGRQTGRRPPPPPPEPHSS